ncbi:MAG: histidinol-phosphate transaminase [Gammaproteobacteria bacterium]|nr:histidinol-phosphate transaminase [Gammaproteobacteria bacterium]
MTSRINKLLRPGLQELSAYHVPASEGLIKLDAMENPYSLSAPLQQEWLEVLRTAKLNRYPDAAADELKQTIKGVLQLPQQCELMLGNGSDELIQLLSLAVLDAPARKSARPIVMAPEPSFVMYRHTAVVTGMDYLGVPLQSGNFALDMPAMLKALQKHQPEILYLAYPNNPTGNLFLWNHCQELIENAPGLVVIDEAYHPFAETSATHALVEYDHVLLLRTFSKLGLAGIRLGVLAGPLNWLQHFEKLRLPYNINVLTQLSARFACHHYDVFLQQSAQIRQQRSWMLKELKKLPVLQVFDSQANFILFRVPDGSSARLFENLIYLGVLIKNMDRSHPLLKDCMRVTVGTSEENKCFLTALEQSMRNL